MGGDVALHQRVAVGRGAGHGLAGDDATTAALVLHHERLAQHRAPALRHHAGDHVVTAAGGHGDDVADGLRGVTLGAREAGKA